MPLTKEELEKLKKKIKLQPLTYCNLDGSEKMIKFVQYHRRNDEIPKIIATAKTTKEYDEIAKKYEIEPDARNWFETS